MDVPKFRTLAKIISTHIPKRHEVSANQAEYFSKLKEIYSFEQDEAFEYIRSSENQTVRSWVSIFLTGEKVLDLGCGPGFDAKYYDPKRYLGIDFSPDLINLARSENPLHLFEVGNLCDLRNLKDYSFDYAYFKSVLEHTESLGMTLKMLFEANKKSIKGIIVVWHTAPEKFRIFSNIHKVHGHFSRLINQNQYPEWPFFLLFKYTSEVVGVHTVWRISNVRSKLAISWISSLQGAKWGS